MPADVSRRHFLEYAGAGLASYGGAVAFEALRSALSGRGDATGGDPVLQQAGQSQLATEDVVHELCGLSSAGLVFRFQNFWDIYRSPADLRRLDALCISKKESAKPDDAATQRYLKDPHRLRVFPTLPRIHLLACARPEDADDYRAFIHNTHAGAFSGENCNRQVLEIIWQNATALLNRNDIAWRSAVFGTELIADALGVCRLFLEEDVFAFHPAIAAWQFLLTYDRALAFRSDIDNRKSVQRAISEIGSHPIAQDSYWFRELADIYRGRHGLDDMLPQMNEVLIGSAIDRTTAKSSEGRFGRKVLDYFFLVRLQNGHLGEQARAGALRTRFRSEAQTSTIGMRSAEVLNNFGSAEDWLRAEGASTVRDPRKGLSTDAARFWFPEHLRILRKVKVTTPESPETIALYKTLYPFKSLEARRVAARAWGGELSIEEYGRLMTKERSPLGGLAALALPCANLQGAMLRRHFPHAPTLFTEKTLRDSLAALPKPERNFLQRFKENVKWLTTPRVALSVENLQDELGTARSTDSTLHQLPPVPEAAPDNRGTEWHQGEKAKRVIGLLRREFDRRSSEVVDLSERDLFTHLYGLLLRVYELHLAGKCLTRTQAGDLIPLRNSVSHKKYIDYAASRELLKFETSPVDARVELVVAGPRLEAFVRREVDDKLRQINELCSIQE